MSDPCGWGISAETSVRRPHGSGWPFVAGAPQAVLSSNELSFFSENLGPVSSPVRGYDTRRIPRRREACCCSVAPLGIDAHQVGPGRGDGSRRVSPRSSRLAGPRMGGLGRVSIARNRGPTGTRREKKRAPGCKGVDLKVAKANSPGFTTGERRIGRDSRRLVCRGFRPISQRGRRSQRGGGGRR